VARHLLTDGGGHTLGLLDATGRAATTQLYAYDVFGNLLPTKDATGQAVDAATRLLYRGEWWDAGLGRQYLRARWYDPSTGRFASQDPREAGPGDAANANLYLYAAGDAVNGMDPSGYITLSEIQVALANGINLFRLGIKAVRIAQTGISAVRTGLELYSLFGDGGLTRIRQQVTQIYQQWGQIPKGTQTEWLKRDDFWVDALDALSVNSGWLLTQLFNNFSGTIQSKYAKRKSNPFVWVVYMPTPVEEAIPNPSFRIPLPGIRLASVPVVMQFGHDKFVKNAGHRGRLLGLGIRELRTKADSGTQQFFRMDYHDPSHGRGKSDSAFTEYKSSKYRFHFHVR